MPGSPPPPEATPPLRLEVPAQLASVEPTRRAVLEFLGMSSLSPGATYRLELVLEELLMNAARHAFPAGGDALVALTVSRDGTALRLVFEDQAAPFDPTVAPEPAPAARLQDMEPGGRGLILLRRYARRLAYERVGASNRLEVDLGLD